jgi:hypothetical protein
VCQVRFCGESGRRALSGKVDVAVQEATILVWYSMQSSDVQSGGLSDGGHCAVARGSLYYGAISSRGAPVLLVLNDTGGWSPRWVLRASIRWAENSENSSPFREPRSGEPACIHGLDATEPVWQELLQRSLHFASQGWCHISAPLHGDRA